MAIRSAVLVGAKHVFSYLFMVQVAHTALSNAHGQLEERLARWLLMACDRSNNEEMALAHESLAFMLGVRRASVTTALQHLAARGLIETGRGSVTIKDKEGLEESAAGLYGVQKLSTTAYFNTRHRLRYFESFMAFTYVSVCSPH